MGPKPNPNSRPNSNPDSHGKDLDEYYGGSAATLQGVMASKKSRQGPQSVAAQIEEEELLSASMLQGIVRAKKARNEAASELEFRARKAQRRNSLIMRGERYYTSGEGSPSPAKQEEASSVAERVRERPRRRSIADKYR